MRPNIRKSRRMTNRSRFNVSFHHQRLKFVLVFFTQIWSKSTRYLLAFVCIRSTKKNSFKMVHSFVYITCKKKEGRLCINYVFFSINIHQANVQDHFKLQALQRVWAHTSHTCFTVKIVQK
jgi:hypothetical protein